MGKRYFMIKSPLENLTTSCKLGVWATQKQNERAFSPALER